LRDVLSLFTTDQTARLTKLSSRQLAYWDKTGFFQPAERDDEGPFCRLYTFREIVELRTLGLLRRRVRLEQLREVKDVLGRYAEPWASLEFWVGGGTVYWENPESNTRESVRPRRQSVMPVAMAKIEQEVATEVRSLVLERLPEDNGRITQNRYIKHNAPVVSGTRVPVAAILSFHMAGFSADEIMAEYPRLTPEDIAAAIEWEQGKKAS
jgi:uncharacterized protein (DUF433 family)